MAYLLSQSRLLLHMGILRPPLGCLSSDLDSQLSSYSVARNHMQRCTRVLKRAVSPGPRPTVTAHLSVPQRVFFPTATLTGTLHSIPHTGSGPRPHLPPDSAPGLSLHAQPAHQLWLTCAQRVVSAFLATQPFLASVA